MTRKQQMGLSAKPKLLHKDITGEILDGFFTVYNVLGYGFLERVYANALAFELRNRWMTVEREVPCDVRYESEVVGSFRMDMVVSNVVVVEAKACATVVAAEERQLYNYLRASPYQVGLLLHFGPRPTFKRFVIQESRVAR